MARLSTIPADVSELFGSGKPLWLTEYGYQTNPPDRILGVSYAAQSAYIGEAALRVWEEPGVTILNAPPGTKLRLRTPQLAFQSPTLVVS